MNVLLINPSFNRYGGMAGHGGTMMPLNLCCLAAYGRHIHPEATFAILDAEVEGLSHEQTAGRAAESAPDLLGITANTCSFDSVIALVGTLKERFPDAPVVLGGPHPSALPERSLAETGADLAVVGEGEVPFAEIIARLKAGAADWSDVPGLAYRDAAGQYRVNAPAHRIADLDALPFPARDLVDLNAYTPPPTKRVGLGRNTIIAASRGCPYNCGFCGAKSVWRSRLHRRSAESIVDEIQECVEHHDIRTLNFTDELFTSDKEHVLAVCRLLRERELEIRWVCSARAQRLDDETLLAMFDAGCREISFGIESGNVDILERMNKALDLDEAAQVIARTKKAGITTHASYMFGYIGETEQTMKDTLEFAKRMNTAVAAFFIASPLPGTALYEEALDKGYLRADATWLDYSPLANREPVLNLPGLSAQAIRRWHRKALRTYYWRPAYVLSRLLAIRHWHEFVNLLKGVRLLLSVK